MSKSIIVMILYIFGRSGIVPAYSPSYIEPNSKKIVQMHQDHKNEFVDIDQSSYVTHVYLMWVIGLDSDRICSTDHNYKIVFFTICLFVPLSKEMSAEY